VNEEGVKDLLIAIRS